MIHYQTVSFPGPRARLEDTRRRASLLRAEAAALRLELEQEEDLRHGAPRRYWWASSVCHRADLRARADEADAAAYWLEAEVDGRTRSLEAAQRVAGLTPEAALRRWGYTDVTLNGLRERVRAHVEDGTIRVEVRVPAPRTDVPLTITKVSEPEPDLPWSRPDADPLGDVRAFMARQAGRPYSWHTAPPAWDLERKRVPWVWRRQNDERRTPAGNAEAWRRRAQHPRPLRWEPWPTVQDGTRRDVTIAELLSVPDVVRRAVRQLEGQLALRAALGLGTPTFTLPPPTRRQRARSALRRAGEWLRGRS